MKVGKAFNSVENLKQGFSTCGPHKNFWRVTTRPGITEIDYVWQDDPLFVYLLGHMVEKVENTRAIVEPKSAPQNINFWGPWDTVEHTFLLLRQVTKQRAHLRGPQNLKWPRVPRSPNTSLHAPKQSAQRMCTKGIRSIFRRGSRNCLAHNVSLSQSIMLHVSN